ncbi:hypothetical protein A9Q81_13795 [Gammaproteobacteria bacterium 42_54_T18]|nr:hypothetical protein A9Q81_13795 [Gammaproteobacteria bacterium 42_54_T18]
MRTRKAPEERKAEIITAATLLVNQYGYKKVAMVDVANAIGVSKAALYVYFPTKDALFEAVVFQSLEAPLAAIKAASETQSNTTIKLTCMLVESFSLALYKPKPMIELINSSRGYAQNILKDHTQQSLDLYSTVLNNAQQRGEITLPSQSLNIEDAAKLVLSCAHGAALGTNIGSPILPPKQMKARITALIHSLIKGWS